MGKRYLDTVLRNCEGDHPTKNSISNIMPTKTYQYTVNIMKSYLSNSYISQIWWSYCSHSLQGSISILPSTPLTKQLTQSSLSERKPWLQRRNSFWVGQNLQLNTCQLEKNTFIPWILTNIPWKRTILKGHLIFQPLIFRGYRIFVSFSEGILKTMYFKKCWQVWANPQEIPSWKGVINLGASSLY